MICPKCGEFMQDDDLFCGNCGYKKEYVPEFLRDNPEPQKPEKPDKKDKKYLYILIPVLCLLVIAVVVLIVFALNSGNNDDITTTTESTSIEDLFSEPDTTSTIWQPSEPDDTTFGETTSIETTEAVDYELQALINTYSSGLVEENRTYEITLEESDWNISFRSSPVLDKTGSNFICNIKDGTTVDVKYIYNGIWALFEYDGKWGFSSIYASADPNEGNIMTPIG